MITAAVIRDTMTGREVAVLVHDDEHGRLVYRVRPADGLLLKALDVLVARPLEIHEEDASGAFTRRRRVTRTDRDFLRHFVDRSIRHPYAVDQLERLEGDDADALVDTVYDHRVCGTA